MMLRERIKTTIEAEQPIEEIIEELRKVRIVEEPEAYPYRSSTIGLEEINLSEIQPMALYVVRNGLRRQAALREDLLHLRHDTLHLESALHFSYEGMSSKLVPPIVEETDEGLCLMDGLHRAMIARSIGEKTMKVLHITNINPDYPLTSFPNGWDEVVCYERTPIDRKLKKNYRHESHFFRDLSEINGSKRRGAGDAS